MYFVAYTGTAFRRSTSSPLLRAGSRSLRAKDINNAWNRLYVLHVRIIDELINHSPFSLPSSRAGTCGTKEKKSCPCYIRVMSGSLVNSDWNGNNIHVHNYSGALDGRGKEKLSV